MPSKDTKLPCSRETKRKYELIKRQSGLPFTAAVDKAADLLAAKLGLPLQSTSSTVAQPISAPSP